MNASNGIARLRRLRRRPDSPHRAVSADRQGEARREAMRAADSVFARVAFFTEQDRAAWRPRWRRFPAAGVASGFAIFLLMLGFAFVLRPRVRALPQTSAIVATLVEPPPPKPIEPKKIAPAAPATIAPRLSPRHEARRHAPPKPKPRPIAPPPISESATSSHGSIPVSPSKEAPAPAAPGPSGESAQGEAGAGASENGGARAIYAPLPKIPDELRQDAFSAVAVAHFVVGPDGKVQVTLTTPTPDPKLNELLLETLHEWKFFPAIKDGVAIASQFDVRIPISVQ